MCEWHEREATIRRTLDGEGSKAPKNGVERIIVLPPLALQALSMVARRTDSPYVLPHPAWAAARKGFAALPVASRDRRVARRNRARP
jgi:hypothetical protein